MLGLQGDLVEPLGQGLEGLLPPPAGPGWRPGSDGCPTQRPLGFGSRAMLNRSGSGNTLGSRLAAEMNHRGSRFDECACRAAPHPPQQCARGLGRSIIARAFLSGAHRSASRVLLELLPLVWMLDEGQDAHCRRLMVVSWPAWSSRMALDIPSSRVYPPCFSPLTSTDSRILLGEIILSSITEGRYA